MAITFKEKEYTLYILDEIKIEDTEQIFEFYELYKKRTEPLEKKPEIKIYINSNGGSSSACFAIVDVIEQLCEITKVTGIATGACGSSAFAIWLSTNNRIIRPRTTFCFHDVQSWWYGGSTEDYARLVDYLKIHREYYIEIVLKNTILKREVLDKVIESSKDWFITPDEMEGYLRKTKHELLGN